MNKRLLCNILIYGAIGLIIVSWLPAIFGVTTNYAMLGVWTVVLKVVAIIGYLGKKSLALNEKKYKGGCGICCEGELSKNDREAKK